MAGRLTHPEGTNAAEKGLLSAQRRVLVVDDERDIRSSMGLLLEDGVSVQVIEARDGLEALEILDREPVDVLITDYKMPRMNGLALLGIVAKRYPDLPTILVTAYPDPGIRDAAGRHPGFAGFITKPFEPGDLLERVEAALAQIAG